MTPAPDPFKPALRRFADWVGKTALPFWLTAAWDARRGGFHEALAFDGRPALQTFRRVRVQARQVHVFATASRLSFADGEALARAGFDYLIEKACPDFGARGCVHRLSPDGAIQDARRDLYDQAFLLLACASMHRAFGDPRALDLAARACAYLDEALASPSGGYAEDDSGTLPRRQNPHMHLFEAFLALYEATGEEGYRARADAMLSLFEQKFFDRKAGVLREFFDDDWRADPQKGRVIEPGHMAEWVWLLARRERLGGADFAATKRALFFSATAACDAAGFLVDEATIGAAPSGARRLWPQTEFIKAAIAMDAAGDPAAAAAGAAMIARLFETYLAEPVAGLWCDRFDAAGGRMAQDVPASILYHLFDAAAEARAHLERS